MFCRNCGYNNADGVRFCAKCGSSLEAAPAAPAAPSAPTYGAAPNYAAPTGAPYGAPAGAPTYGAPTRSAGAASSAKVRQILPIAVIGVVAAIVVILLFSLIFGSSAKSVANKAVKYTLNGDFYKISKLYHKEIIKDNDWDDKSFKEDCKDMKEEFQEYMNDLEDEQGKVKLSYKIKDEDEITGDEFDAIEEEYDDNYDLKVKKAKQFEVELCIEIDGEEEETEQTITVVKIGGKWYLYDDFGGLF